MTTITEPLIDYTPKGAALRLFECRDSEVLIVGAAGTGKSLAALHKLNAIALQNPGMRGLIVRKTQVSLTSSGLVTFKRDVVPKLEAAEIVKWYGGSREEAAGYRYQNGSKIEIGGLDKSSKIMSTEYDTIYVQEATELTQEDWESLTTRLRNGVVSFQQLIADCNPDSDTHWLHKRTMTGTTTELVSRHKDNPMLWDTERKTWTSRGTEYMNRLDGLSGVRRRRLLDGEWSSAEGVVYEEWDSAVHLIDSFDPPKDWQRFWSVDFGFTNPFVCQMWAEDDDGRLYLYKEWYKTQGLVSDHGERLLKEADQLPDYIICDHDAEGRAQLVKVIGMRTVAAKKAVRDGIQAVKERLKIAGDGKPRLFIMRDALIERDPRLAESAKPTCTAEEITGYVWASSNTGTKEEPVKEDDHGCLVAGTRVTTIYGEVPIERVRVGDRVLTRRGWRRVTNSAMTQIAAEVLRLTTDRGSLVGTGDHPVWVEDEGWVRLDALRYGMMIPCPDPLFTEAGLTDEKQTDPITSGLPQLAPNTFTAESMKTPTGSSLMDTRFTTSTLTRPTMTQRTSRLFPKENIKPSIRSTVSPRAYMTRLHPRRSPPLPSGTDPQREELGTPNMAETSGKTASRPTEFVTTVASHTARFPDMVPSASARTTANLPPVEHQVWTTKSEPASVVGAASPSTDTPPRTSAPAHVVAVTAITDRVPVFNLTIEGEHEFYANGLLVSNCDSLRYVVAHRDPYGLNFASVRQL